MAKFEILTTVTILAIIPNGYGFNFSWEPYSEDDLPTMYVIDDYSKCEERKGLFCKAEIFLRSEDPDSTMARQIQKSHQYSYRFYRSSLFRMMCIDDHEVNSQEGIRKYVKRVMSKELERYNVSVEVPSCVCEGADRSFDTYDYVIWMAVLSYLWLVYHSTQYDWKRGEDPNFQVSKYDKWLKIFSLRENWNRAIVKSESPDFQKLKCVQGLRFYVTLWVIMCHTKASMGLLFYDNPKDFERIWTHPFVKELNLIDLYVVQIYLLISTMLLTNQIYEIHRNYGYYSLGHCCNLYLNRIVRFLPTMLLATLLSARSMKLTPRGSTLMDHTDTMLKACSANWWSTALQVNYIHKLADMCLQGTWYLSVDTFLYLTTSIIMYVHLKYKLDLKKVLLVVFMGMSMNFSYIIYVNNFDMLCKPSVELLRRLFNSIIYETLYLSPFSSWNTCCVGIAAGAIFYHIKNKDVKLNAVQQLIWALTLILAPLIVITISLANFRRIYRALIGPLLKPTFAMAFGILILGVSKGYGGNGVVRRVLEWEFARKMGSFTFCTYVYHFFFVFGRGVVQTSLAHFSISTAVFDLIQDFIVAFLVGIPVTVITEMPGLTLQKMYVPQIKKHAIKKTGQKEKKLE